MANRRKRIRVPVEFSAQQLEAIDAARGSSSRAEFCRQRVVLTEGFGDPIYDTCARLMGAALSLCQTRYEEALDAGDLLAELKCSAAALRQDRPGSAELDARLTRLEGEVARLASLAAQRMEHAGELLGLAKQLARHLAAVSDRRAYAPWQRPGKR